MGTFLFTATFSSSRKLISSAPSLPEFRFFRLSTNKGASSKLSSSCRPSGVLRKKLLFLACRNS